MISRGTFLDYISSDFINPLTIGSTNQQKKESAGYKKKSTNPSC
jgi:hypothetical protein